MFSYRQQSESDDSSLSVVYLAVSNDVSIIMCIELTIALILWKTN